MAHVNLEYYKVFYYVSRTGSLTAAAEKLCISQPAVSQAVKQLERALGIKLFARTSKGVALTEAGGLLYTYVEKGMESLFAGETMVHRLMNLDMGEVRIGASDMTLQFYLLPYLERFHEKYPKIKVTVSNAPTPETIGSLSEGKIDFGVVSTPFGARSGMISTPVKEIRNVFVAGCMFSHLRGRKLNYECLRELPCIFLEKRTSTRAFMDEFLEENGIVVEPEFELATSDMIVQFAKRNLGIGCVMSEFAGEALGQGKLFALEFDREMPNRQICVVSDEKNLISLSGKRLLEMLFDK